MFRTAPQQFDKAACETVYLETRWLPDKMTSLKVAVGATKDNAVGEYATVSLQIISFDEKWHCSMGSVWLTPDEVDEVAAGLLEAKRLILEMRDNNNDLRPAEKRNQ